MKNQSINISNSTVGDVNQVAADTINNSFNKIAKSDAPDELKEHLEKLNAAVKEMIQRLPEMQQKQAAQDLQTVTDEALSEKPRRKVVRTKRRGSH